MDRTETAKWHRRAAEPGNPAAQDNLGLMDHAETAKWHRRAAEPGAAVALASPGLITEDQGRGVPKVRADAVTSVRKAAENGDADAQNNLGDLYAKGQGVPQDYSEAVKWIRRAARQGNAKAQNNLGVMYREGRGVPQDHILAYMWFHLATSRLPASEKEDREKAEKNRDGIASIMTPAQLAEAELLARGWKPMEEN
jgi:TPR repeat protein